MGEAKRKRGGSHHYELVFFTAQNAFQNPTPRRLTVVEGFIRRFRNNEKPQCGACDRDLPSHPLVFYNLIPMNERDQEFGGAICHHCAAEKPEPVSNRVLQFYVEALKKSNDIVEVYYPPQTSDAKN